jgi:hypothetical protein
MNTGLMIGNSKCRGMITTPFEGVSGDALLKNQHHLVKTSGIFLTVVYGLFRLDHFFTMEKLQVSSFSQATPLNYTPLVK